MKHSGKKTERGYVWNSILLMSSIFGLHILLIIGLIVLIVVLQGFLEYTLWIFLGALALIAGSGIWFWLKIKRRNESIANILNNPSFQGKEVEVSFLGGTVNLRLGSQEGIRKTQEALQIREAHEDIPELEDRETVRIRDLKELGRLMEKGLITEEEYHTAKKRLLEND
jgi:uncharacterized protein (DUF58 family)